MDTGVALVSAYLRFNGYISLPEQPILIGEGRPWRYRTATDLDVLAVRFPHAAVVVPRDGGGRANDSSDDLKVAPDRLLDLQEGTVDVLLAEVKEGRPRLNDGLRDPVVLQAALSRLDAGFDDPMDGIARGLIERGETRTEAGGRRWRFRLVAFGDGAPVMDCGPFRAIPLRHTALFLMRCMAEHPKVWRDAQFGDTVLDLLHLLDKLGLGLRWVDRQRGEAGDGQARDAGGETRGVDSGEEAPGARGDTPGGDGEPRGAAGETRGVSGQPGGAGGVPSGADRVAEGADPAVESEPDPRR